jgi:16S rRNA (guanine1207-N2)-methyltransferase
MSRQRRAEEDSGLRPYPQEALLLEAVPQMSGERVICTSPGLAQVAGAAARALPQADVVCVYLDLYRANLAADYWSERPANLRIVCEADLPSGEADIVALPFSASGEAELARELIQAGHQRLRVGGRLYVSTDNRKDTWFRDVLGKVFRKLERRASPRGVLYVGTKTEPLKKLKDFGCQFAFRASGRLIRGYSRPGVFSHRRVDVGARRLMNEMQIEPGARVLDIGCGAGAVALAAACRADGVTVHAVDSNCRAVECTRRGAELNGFNNLSIELNATGDYRGAGAYDLALANPPYYASFRIAEHFLTSGRDALGPGGRILVVTKRPDWYQQHMPEWFHDVTIVEQKGYYLVGGIRPTSL